KRVAKGITEPDKGLQAKVRRLQEALRDNKLERPATQDRLKAIENELNRLARERLNEIPRLQKEAREENQRNQEQLRQLENRLDDRGKKKSNPVQPPTRNNQANLEQARNQQDDVKQALEELLQRFQALHLKRDIEQKIQDIKDRQAKLEKETEKLFNH